MNYAKSIRTLIILFTVTFFLIIGTTVTFAQFAFNQDVESNTDRAGGDYKSFDIVENTGFIAPGVPNFTPPYYTCESACAEDPNCQTWTYVKAGVQGPNGRCWLKGTIPATTANNNCTSGVIKRAFEPNTNRFGSDYKNFTVTDPGTCQSACKEANGLGGCRSWTYVKAGVQGPSARCWLKNDVPAANTDSNAISGVLYFPPR